MRIDLRENRYAVACLRMHKTQEQSSVPNAGESIMAKKTRRKPRRKDRAKDESKSAQKYVVYFELNSLSSKMKHDELSPTLDDLRRVTQFHQRRRKN